MKCFPVAAHLHVHNASEILFFFLRSVSILGYEVFIQNSHNCVPDVLHSFVSTAPQILLFVCTISLHRYKHRHGQKVNTLQGRRKGFPKDYETP